MVLNHSIIPGSRGKVKANDREGKGARREGKQREENLAYGGDQAGEGDNYQLQEEFGCRGEDNYQDICWGQASDVLYTGGILTLQVI